MHATKPAIRSLGVWGSTTGIISWVYMLYELINNIPPDLLDDTRAVYAAIVGIFATLLGLWGRWKAYLKIGSIF